jgi:hypothetical protein
MQYVPGPVRSEEVTQDWTVRSAASAAATDARSREMAATECTRIWGNSTKSSTTKQLSPPTRSDCTQLRRQSGRRRRRKSPSLPHLQAIPLAQHFLADQHSFACRKMSWRQSNETIRSPHLEQHRLGYSIRRPAAKPVNQSSVNERSRRSEPPWRFPCEPTCRSGTKQHAPHT